ncbi:MAG: HAL/PAL/TAL family ammonia-lyase [Alkalispirochaeta sp.]
MRAAPLTLGPDSWMTRADMLRVALYPTACEIKTPPESADVLDHALARGATVYGHSTGYGALASFSSDSESPRHQMHLIAHLATGSGPPFDTRVARALTFDRLVTLSKGRSAAGAELLDYLSRLLATDAAPCIPRFGSVGASGDLTPLAHLATVMRGEGTYLPGRDPKLPPFQFARRDALALVNGTSASTGLAVLGWWDVAALVPLLIQSMALMVGAQQLARGAYAESLHTYRGQPGQTAIATAMREALTSVENRSEPIDGAESSAHRLPTADLHHEETLQSAYSFRCIPQVLGPTVEMLWHTGDTLEREINAVTDNPVFEAPDRVHHGGNFHGQVIAQACDSLALGVANLSILLDRQIARITDPLLNHGLPPFLTGDSAGAHSGFMGAQVSATALTAELSASAQRRYLLQSRSTNGANQDVVSMSTLAGVALYESLPRLRELAAIHLLTAVQAAELAGITAHPKLRGWIRRTSPFLTGDRALSADIQNIARGLSWITDRPEDGAPADRTFLGPPYPSIWKTLFPHTPDPTGITQQR